MWSSLTRKAWLPRKRKRPRRKSAPKPKRAIRIYADGREVCDLSTREGRGVYGQRIDEMAVRQKGVCALCGLLLGGDRTFEHEAGRGTGGGHRDDRIAYPDGRWMNAALHYLCNGRKGSRRYYWAKNMIGFFLPRPAD